MKVEVETPEENTGDVIGDLSRRRGMLKGQESEVTGVKITLKYRCLKCSDMQLSCVL